MNDTVATEDQEQPLHAMSLKLVSMIGIPVVGLHQGPRTHAPHQQAGHMTAADQIVRNIKKVLAIGAVL